MEDGKKVPELIVGRRYKIRATVSGPGSEFTAFKSSNMPDFRKNEQNLGVSAE